MSKLTRSKSQPATRPSLYRLRDYGNVPLPTKIINAGFNIARRAIKRFTGFMQVKGRRVQNFKGYRRMTAKRNETDLRPQKYSRQFRVIDFADDILYDCQNKEIYFRNADGDEIQFQDATQTPEWQLMAGQYIYYKIVGAKITFQAPSGPLVYSEDKSTETAWNALQRNIRYPLILGQLYNDYRSDLALDMDVNQPTVIFDPNKSMEQSVYLAFNQRFLHQVPPNYVVTTVSNPWVAGEEPIFKIQGFAATDMNSMTGIVPIGTVIIQVKFDCLSKDNSARIGHELPALVNKDRIKNKKLNVIKEEDEEATDQAGSSANN